MRKRSMELYEDPECLNEWVEYAKQCILYNGDDSLYGGDTCGTCGKSYAVKGSLTRHKRYFCGRKSPPITGYIKWSDEDFECQTCQRHYKRYETVKRHIKHECQKSPSIECPVPHCKYKGKFRYCVVTHCRMVHKLEL
ncbi:hypothetical protein JTB14_025841 [Gonioctena quinquepunctata]|nr:hypothetical protein JTB14_025841 [Gonioctena quinquepunctata]